MYLLNYDFYDLHALITFFRQNTKSFSLYKSPVEQMISYVNAPMPNNGIEINTIRKILKPYVNKNDKFLSWVLIENAYTANIFIIKNKAYYNILSSIFKEMLQCYNDEQQLYLLCDASHNIPLFLADINKPKKAIKAVIKDYKKRYNQNFLLTEMKNI